MNFVRRICHLTLLLVGCTAATTVAELNIENAVISPDGFEKNAIVVNGISPGIVLTATKGESFQVKVNNMLTDESMNKSTSIHWHGILQQHSNEMDGAAFVNQCPIAPGNSFTYRFTPPDQAGAFWYHSHVRLQYCEGLRGALSLYDVDDASTIITLTDWYHINAFNVVATTVPDSLLINGAGRYVGGPSTPLSVINVVKGKRYRMRLISMACKFDYLLSIDNHAFTVIEADGELTRPLIVDSIPISAAQRYSFILEANQTADNYFIRANPISYTSNFSNELNSAILRYSGAPIEDPPTRTWPLVNPLVESNLHPLSDLGVPGVPGVGKADINLNLVGHFNNASGKFDINGVTYVAPETPVLLQILSGALTVAQLKPQGSVYTLPPNKVVEVSFPGTFLLNESHKFYVVRSAGTADYNYVNPVLRDTVASGGPSENVTIRFTTDNSGPWLLHWGLGIVFVEDAAGTALSNPVNIGITGTTHWENLEMYIFVRPQFVKQESQVERSERFCSQLCIRSQKAVKVYYKPPSMSARLIETGHDHIRARTRLDIHLVSNQVDIKPGGYPGSSGAGAEGGGRTKKNRKSKEKNREPLAVEVAEDAAEDAANVRISWAKNES
ncbi:yellow laccase [Melanogaster broomeanus]|nr:yellow laccase [Melanogaster broomeanus]